MSTQACKLLTSQVSTSIGTARRFPHCHHCSHSRSSCLLQGQTRAHYHPLPLAEIGSRSPGLLSRSTLALRQHLFRHPGTSSVAHSPCPSPISQCSPEDSPISSPLPGRRHIQPFASCSRCQGQHLLLVRHQVQDHRRGISLLRSPGGGLAQ